MGGGDGGEGRWARLSNFFYKESKSKKKNLVGEGGGLGEGARVLSFLLRIQIENKNKKNFWGFWDGWVGVRRSLRKQTYFLL